MRQHTEGKPGSQSDEPSVELANAIWRFQELFHAAKQARNLGLPLPDSSEQSAILRQVYHIVHEPLKRETRAHWMASRAFREQCGHNRSEEGIERAVECLAYTLFTYLLDELPRLKIDESRNVIGLMVVVARRAMLRDERRIHQPPGSDTARPEPIRLGEAYGEGRAFEIEDPQAEHAFADVERRQDLGWAQEQFEAFLNHPARTREDKIILHGRILAEPSISYKDLTVLLGSGWTEAAVRKRFERLCKRLRGEGE